MKMSQIYSVFLEFVADLARNRLLKKRKSKLSAFVSDADFHPFLQPIFNTAGTGVIGCEVLLRVKTDEGYQSPVNFIKDLENSQHINRVTINLLKDVSHFFLKQDYVLPDDFYFSFNIHAPQLSSPDMVNEIQQFSKKFIGKARLVLEIVERGILKFEEQTIDIMDKLMEYGIRFAIDDFGAGTSSLKYIEHDGFSTIKIDRELTASSGNELIYQKVIEAIVMLSSQLGLTVTAEGVENPVQLELLHKAGVNAMQGYYLAKPMGMPAFSKAYLHYE